MDIVFCIIPKLDPYAPTTGPALLKSHCEAAGFSACVKDYNIDLYNYLKKQNLHKSYFFDNDNAFISWFWPTDYEYPNEWYELYDVIEPKMKEWVNELKRINPTWVGISMLSATSMCVGRKLCELLREHAPKIKIVLGGAAVRNETKIWLDNGWADCYVYGDGEFPIIDVLNGNFDAPGINTITPFQVENLNDTLIPNYDDINWNEYEFGHDMSPVYITASRGCVKKCTFCDVPILWPTYKWRTADHVFAEIELLYTKHNRRMFRFTDSLVNGSASQFRELLKKIIEFNKTKEYDHEEIRWHSQWIVRPRSQMTEEDFKLMADSNVNHVDIGLESFSESVRWHMGKKFTDDDLWWNLEMMYKYNIHYTLLMITGYPTETEEDHQITLDSIKRMNELGYISKGGNMPDVAYMSFGNMMMLQPDYKIYKMIKDDPTFVDDSIGWSYKDNTPEVRIKRHIEANDLVEEYTGRGMSWLSKKQLRRNLAEIEREKKMRENENHRKY